MWKIQMMFLKPFNLFLRYLWRAISYSVWNGYMSPSLSTVKLKKKDGACDLIKSWSKIGEPAWEILRNSTCNWIRSLGCRDKTLQQTAVSIPVTYLSKSTFFWLQRSVSSSKRRCKAVNRTAFLWNNYGFSWWHQVEWGSSWRDVLCPADVLLPVENSPKA